MQKSKIRPKSSQNNNINNNNRNNSTYQKDTKYAESKIISKYLKTGFESLTVEELAVTLISPTFEKTFQETTKTKWPLENKSKAKERLNYAKFNIEWNASQNSKTKFNSGIQFNILFTLAEKGDIQKISEYLNKNYNYKKEIISTVDQNKKSLLHIAAKNGHTQLCKFLIQNGFSVHARDKFLRTPLHLACQFGRETVADELIKAKSDIFARDSIGRTALHYAACSDSENLITLLLGINPDLVNARDTYGRTPLHYAVWNGTSKQKEITRKLLMANAEVDAEDEEGMTALHFAADAGKGKVIPILLEFGANPFKKDGRTNRTAIELACNDRIREMIIVYSGKEYKPQIDELKIEGKKMFEEKKENNNNDFNQNNFYNDDVNNNNNNSVGRNGMSNNNSSRFRGGKNKNNIYNNNNIHIENGRPSSNPMGHRRVSNYNNNNIKNNVNNNNINNQNEMSESMDGEIKNLMFSENKQKLVNQLSNIQNFGIQTMQHLQNPELYSGSWLEKITNANDLYNYLSKLSPQESAIAIFNVLQPYKKSMPQSKGEEQNFKNFFEPKEIKTIREKLNKKKMMNNNFDDEGNFIQNQNEINNLNNNNNNINNNFDSDIYNSNSVNTKKEIDELREEIKKLNEKIIDNKKESENQEYLKIKEELEKYQTENQQLKEQTKEYSNQIKILTNDVKKFENETKELQKKENEKKDKIIEDLTTKLNLLNTEYENTKNKKFSLKSNNPKIFQNINNNNNNNLNINDEENIYVFLKLCDSQGGLYNLLLKFDYDNDNFLLKNEFNNLLDNLNLNIGYRNSVLKLSGFDNNFKLSIKNIFSKFYNNRNNKNNILNNTLFNIVYKLNDSKKDFDQFVNCLYNISENNYINKKTFNDTIIRENLLITEEDLNNIYSNWSYDNKRNEADLNIETEELCKLLKSRKDVIDQIGNMSNNIKFGKNFNNKNNNFNNNNNSNIYNTGNSNVYINNNNNNNFDTSQFNNNMSYNKYNNVINNNESQNINTNNNILNKGSTITMKNDDNEVIKDNSETLKKQLNEHNNYYGNQEEVEEEEEENSDIKKIPEISNINEKIGNLYNSKIDDNKNTLNNKETSTIIDITNNNNTKSILNNNNSSINDNSSINNINVANTNSKRKTLFDPDEIINGELKVQVKHILDLQLPKSIQNPFTFSLSSILEGINEEPNSKEITVDNLKEIKFNWSIRFILKKQTLKNLSSNCKIILNFGKTILGVTSFNWTKCLNKKNYDKYVINDYFQVLNKKNNPIGNICIYAKFIPFGFKTSNFDKNGKKRKIKRNINDIIGEDSQDSYSTVKSKKSVVNNPNNINEIKNNVSKIKSNSSHNEEVEEEHKENEEVEEEEKELEEKVDVKYKENNEEKSKEKVDVKSEEKVEEEKVEEEKVEEDNNNNNIENKNEINGSNNNQEEEEYNEKFEEDIPEQFENNDDEDNKKIENGSSKLSMNNNNNNNSESAEILIKEIDCEVTNILDKDNINDKYYLIVNYKNNNEEITCYNSKEEKNFLKEIKATPFTFNFMIYTNTKEKNFNFNINIIDDNEEIVSQININLENKNVFTVNDRYNLTGKENITLFLKFNVNTQGNEDDKE